MKKYQKYSTDSMNIREFIDRIIETGKMLKEDMVPPQGGEEYEEYSSEEEMTAPQGEGMVPQQGEDPEMAGMQYVDQIRKAAIEGIEAFVDNVDSPSYDFFKKVFMMADKVLSQDNEEEK